MTPMRPPSLPPHSLTVHMVPQGKVRDKRIWYTNQGNWRKKQRSDKKQETTQKRRREDTHIDSNTVESLFIKKTLKKPFNV